MALYKISSSRVNNIEPTEYAGGTNELGLIWYDEVTGALRLYNGLPGGRIINSGGGGIPGGNNTQVQFNNNGVFAGSAGLTFDSGSAALSTGSVAAVGNITTGAFFIGDGSKLTGIPAVYGNSNVAAFLPTYTGNLVSLTGNVTTTANVSARFFIGDGSKLTGITAQGLPTQAGNAGLFLSTDGSNVVWNGALGSSLTFSGGQSASDEFANDLNGGGANEDFVGSTNILCGNAVSNYDLTLSAVALTGQAEDVIISGTPVTANSVGAPGQVAFDFDWFYICVATNNWKRAALASW